MNFFKHQDIAKSQSRKLLLLFLLATFAIMVFLVFVVTVAYELLVNKSFTVLNPRISWSDYFFTNHLDTTIVVSVVTLFVIGGISLYRTIKLASGGRAIAKMMDATPISYSTTDIKEQVLMNLVDEMAIASGISRPGVFVLEDEQGLNAFAAGYSPNSAIVCATRGLLNKLTRDELQGVIGHEFSHILNGDMRMNVKMMGMLSGIVFIGSLGGFLMRSTTFRTRARYNGRGAVGLYLLGLIFYLIGSIGLLFGRIIRSAVSRQREYLADASAVQFTRNPHGIASALNKIRMATYGAMINNAMASEMSHFFFSDAVLHKLNSKWLASHPPIEERILRIDPNFDLNASVPGMFSSEPVPPEDNSIEYEKSVPAQTNSLAAPAATSGQDDADSGIEFTPITTAAIKNENFRGGNEAHSVHHHVTTDQVIGSVGTVNQQQMNYGHDIQRAIPQVIYQAMCTLLGARAVVYSLLLDSKKERRDKQITMIAQQDDAAVAKYCLELYPVISQLGLRFRFPILELVTPNLRDLEQSKSKYGLFFSLLRELILFDGKIDLFELIVMITVEIDLRANAGADLKVKYKSVKSVADRFKILFALFAHYGHQGKQEKQAAYISTLKFSGITIDEFPRLNAVKYSAIQAAMREMLYASAEVKQKFLESCFHCAMLDGEIIIQEYELLRMVAKILDCPIPPMSQAA